MKPTANKASIKDDNPFQFKKLSSYDKGIAVFRVWSNYSKGFRHVVADRDMIEARIVWLAGEGKASFEEQDALDAINGKD